MAPATHVVLVSLFAAIFQGVTAQDLPVTQACLGCICEAISNCDVGAGCSDGVCGPFKITWAYWADGGKPTTTGKSPDDNDAYGTCGTNTYCSALAVQGYMKKYQQDCNGDGKIDCDDFALIHVYGGNGCVGTTMREPFGERYRQCKKIVGK